MKEIPKWLKITRTVSIVILVLILFILRVILLLAGNASINSGAEWLDTFAGIFLFIGALCMVGDTLTSPFFICFLIFVLITITAFTACERDIKKHGETKISSKTLSVILGGSAGFLCMVCVIFGWNSIAALPYHLQGASLIKQADEIIPLREKSLTHYGGIFDDKTVRHDAMLIDYDKPRISVVYRDHDDNYNWDDYYWTVRLKNTSTDTELYNHITNDYYIEAVVDLASPGKRVISCYDDTEKEFSKAFILEMENGDIYCLDDVPEKAKGDFSKEISLVGSDYFYKNAEPLVYDAYVQAMIEAYGE